MFKIIKRKQKKTNYTYCLIGTKETYQQAINLAKWAKRKYKSRYYIRKVSFKNGEKEFEIWATKHYWG